jgi:DNA ligase-1
MTPLRDLVETSRIVAETPGRNAKIAALAAFFRRLEAAEIPIGVSYLSGETRQGRTGIGYALFQEARADIAAETAPLALEEVDAAFARIVATSGAGSKAARARILAELLSRATPAERDFLFRLVQGELRQGALESLVTDAVAVASSLPAAAVREAAMVAHGVVSVAQAALTEGAAGLARYTLAPMQPIAPMLAKPAGDIAEALAALGTAAFEWKLDGARVQVHKVGDDVRVFTRQRNDVTASAPEIVAAIRALSAHELILDGEAIALQDGGAPQPFQLTMRRFGRTLDVQDMQASLPLAAFFFDCLRVDGEALTRAPESTRFAALAQALPSELLRR